MDNRAIGVFDSGLGGLTTVKELHRILPQEDIIYLGDTGRVPYGSRSRETIIKYARQDIAFLLQKDIKMVVAACGTVSSTLPREISANLPVPYLDIVLPAAQQACAMTSRGRIGVVGTNATLRSNAFGKQSTTSARMCRCTATPVRCWCIWWKTGWCSRRIPSPA
jgi:glutamate racemase